MHKIVIRVSRHTWTGVKCKTAAFIDNVHRPVRIAKGWTYIYGEPFWLFLTRRYSNFDRNPHVVKRRLPFLSTLPNLHDGLIAGLTVLVDAYFVHE